MSYAPGANPQDVVLVGGRVIGRTLLDRLEVDPRWRVVCIIDDGLEGTELRGIPISSFAAYKGACRSAILALGMPEDKRHFREKATGIGLDFVTYIDAMAIVGSQCTIGKGCVIMPFAAVIDGSTLGCHVYVSIHAGVGKEAQVGDYSTLMNYSSVRAANLGSDVVLSGAVHVLDGAHVGDGCWVAPGTILRKPVPPGQLVWGQPLRAHYRPRRSAESEPILPSGL
jgi:acetyltransferase-like isoleucine patch superfamily enzyme